MRSQRLRWRARLCGLWAWAGLMASGLPGVQAQSGQLFFPTLEAAYGALGFDPRQSNSAVVVLIGDPHINVWPDQMPVTTNLDTRLVAMINAMNPPPTKVVVLGDFTTSLAPMPGWPALSWTIRYGTNEMRIWSEAVRALTNVAEGDLLWIPGNHEQLDSETDADYYRMFYPEMPVRAVMDISGARFFLMNCGNYGGRSALQRDWFRQVWEATPGGMDRIILIHIAPFLQRVAYRGLALDIRDVVGDFDGIVWTVSGHEHAYSLRTYRLGRARVASMVVGTSNPLATNGRSYDTGCALLCLSNGIRGVIYWHLHDGRFRIIGPPNWQAAETYAPAFEDSPGLLWRRLKARGRPPEVTSYNAHDAIEWYAYTRELIWSFPSDWLVPGADEFLLLAGSVTTGATLEVKIGAAGWTNLSWPRPTNGVYRFRLPEVVRPGSMCQFRYRSPGNNDFIGGWGFASSRLSSPGPWPEPDWSRIVAVRAGEYLNLALSGTDPGSLHGPRWRTLLMGSLGAYLEPATDWLRWRVAYPEAGMNLTTQVVAQVGGDGNLVAARAWLTLTAPTHSLQSLILTEGAWLVTDLAEVDEMPWMTRHFPEQGWLKVASPLGYGRNGLVADLGRLLGYQPSAVAVRGWIRSSENGLGLAAPTLRLRAGLRWQVWWNGVEVAGSRNPGLLSVRQRLAQADLLAGTGPNPEVHVPLPGMAPGSNLLAIAVWADWPDNQPLGYWSFDDPALWTNEITGQPLRWVGTNLSSMLGRWGLAALASDTGSYLEAPESVAWSLGAGFTVGGWFAYNRVSGDDPPSAAVEKAGEFVLYYAGTRTNRYRFRVGASEVQDQTAGTVPGQWRFVVGWFDGTNACIQVDNGPIQCALAQGPAVGNDPVRLLRQYGPLGGLAADDVFLYPRVLSDTERTSLYYESLRRRLSDQRPELWLDAEVVGIRVPPPVLTSSLHRVVRRPGEAATLEWAVSSAWPVRYQWWFNGSPLPGATNRWLRWEQLSGAQRGVYTLVASNLGGSVTSPPVHLLVVQAPRLTWERPDPGSGWRLRVVEVDPEAGVVLEVSHDLEEWTEWRRWGPGTISGSQFLSVEPPPSEPTFYRVRLY
ncbi:MAG: LamG-like jellyroll fold domain-containing protein [Verrucomicrobiota bacterium]|nr:metallophosphoesterase [Limisphaera sp.]MDW8382039.1 LamG-like jellyroll fold domain-containing protein [Verrucomicrobiota bacterium]